MDSVNTLQTVATIRTTLIAVGGIAVGFGVATQEQVAALTDPALWTALAGAIVAIAGIVTAVRSRSTKASVDSTAKLPGVEAIITTHAVASASPQSNVVSTVTEAERIVGAAR